MPFLPPAPCLASPFLSTDVAKRADGTRSRGRRAVFFRSLAFSRGGAGATEQQGTAREPTTGRRARRRIATPATYGASSAEREGTTMSRRGRAASEGRGRRCNRATGNRQPGSGPTAVSGVPPPPHHVRILANFIRLLPLASYCADETERRASAAPKATEIHKTRNPRPFTGFFFGLYMHPNRLLDLKIVFNQHPKPLNGITNVFCIGGRSGPVNFLFS